jgi:hypothetical protein
MVIGKETIDMSLIHITDQLLFRQRKVIVEGVHGCPALAALALMSPLMVVLIEP